MLKSLAVANFVIDNNLPLLFSSGCLITCLWSVTVLGYGDVCLGLLCKAPICLLFKYRLLKQMNTCLNLRVFGLPGGTSMLECFNSMMFMLKDTPLSGYPPRSRAGEERSWCPRPGSRAPGSPSLQHPNPEVGLRCTREDSSQEKDGDGKTCHF